MWKRMIAVGVISLGASSGAAAEFDYGTNASLYMSFGFDGPANTDAAGLRYGLRLDHDWRVARQGRDAALVEWQMDDDGFDHIRLGGAPIVSRELILRQDDESGGVVDYLKNNIGTVALAASGAVLLFLVVDGAIDEGDREPGGTGAPANDINCDGPDRPPACQGP